MAKACPKCNQTNPADAMFCLNCASPLGGPAPLFAAAGGAPQSQKGLYSLVLAAAALFCCGPFTGIPAAILGWMELDAIKAGRSSADNRWMALIGLWGGIASTLIHVIGYVLSMMLGVLSSLSAPDYY